MDNNAVEIRSLSKKYESGKFELKDVNMVLPEGSITGLIGENGAGKTTLIKLILDQIKKDEGQITIFGQDSEKDGATVRDNIGIVFSENHFSEDLKPVNVRHIMRNVYSKWDDKLYDDYIDRFGIDKHKGIKDMSRGMKMKVSLAVALSHHAELLILDEATSGLDPVVRDGLMDILYDFVRDGKKSILFSTHITSDLDQVADYITYIRNGQIIMTLSRNELTENYGILKCSSENLKNIPIELVLGVREKRFSVEALVMDRREITEAYPQLVIEKISVEDILTYMRGEDDESFVAQ